MGIVWGAFGATYRLRVELYNSTAYW